MPHGVAQERRLSPPLGRRDGAGRDDAHNLQAEEDAIDAYTKFYELIKDVDTVLADEIKEILNDEMEHRSDLKKIISSICGAADK